MLCFTEELVLISNFIEVREDGKVITEDMTPEDIWNLGDVCKVVKIQWDANDIKYQVENESGILSSLLPDKTGLVYSKSEKEVICVNEDNSIRFRKYALSISGAVSFCWFEVTKEYVGLVFSSVTGGHVRAEFDSASGEKLRIQESR